MSPSRSTQATAYGPYKPVPPPKPLPEENTQTNKQPNNATDFQRTGSQRQEQQEPINTNRKNGLPAMPHVLVTDQGHFHTHSTKFPMEVKDEMSYNRSRMDLPPPNDVQLRQMTLDRHHTGKNNRQPSAERTNSLPRTRPSILTNSNTNSHSSIHPSTNPTFKEDERLLQTGRNSVRFADGIDNPAMNYEPYLGKPNAGITQMNGNGAVHNMNSYMQARPNDHNHPQVNRQPPYYHSQNGYHNQNEHYHRGHMLNHSHQEDQRARQEYNNPHQQMNDKDIPQNPPKPQHFVHFQTDQSKDSHPVVQNGHIPHVYTNGNDHQHNQANKQRAVDQVENSANSVNEQKYTKKDSAKRTTKKISNFKSIISKFSKTDEQKDKQKTQTPPQVSHPKPEETRKENGVTFQADDRGQPLNASFRKAISFSTLHQSSQQQQHISSPRMHRNSSTHQIPQQVQKVQETNGFGPRKSGSCGYLSAQPQQEWNKNQGSHWSLHQHHDDSFGRALPSDHAYPDLHISDSTRGGRTSGGSDSGRGTGGSGADGKVHDTSLESGASSRQHMQSSGNESEWIDITEPEIQNLSTDNERRSQRVNGTRGNGATTPTLPALSPESSPKSRQKVSQRSRAQSHSFNTKIQKQNEIHESPSRNVNGHFPPKNGPTSRPKENFQRSASLLPSSINGWTDKKEITPSRFNKMEYRSDRKEAPKKHSKEPPKQPPPRPPVDDDLTSNDGALDLNSVIDGMTEMTTDDDATSVGDGDDVYLIRKQLEGLEGMYSEVLKLLGSRKHQLRRRMHGSMSSLPSSITSSRPIRERRGRAIDDRLKKTIKEPTKTTHKRFQRLESHVVTLARSVAHLSSEMRTQQLMFQEMEGIRTELASLRAATVGNLSAKNLLNNNTPSSNNLWENVRNMNGVGFSNPGKVKKLTQFFGDEPPLVRIFLRNLGYEKYAPIFEKEKIGMLELPYLSEDRLQKIGIPLGPRLRILQEAQGPIKREGNLSVYVV